METEDGYNCAKGWNEAVREGEARFLGEPLDVTPAPEPSDIIWEN